MRLKIISAVIAAMGLFSTSVSLALDFNDGGYHKVDYPVGDIRVDYDTPEAGTTVEICEGGFASFSTIYHQGQVIFAGGSFSSLWAFDNSKVNINSSGTSYIEVTAFSNSDITFTGGFLGNLNAFGYSNVSVSGGEINNLIGWDDSRITVFGGEIHSLYAFNGNSQVTVSGGLIEDHLYAFESGRVTMTGGFINRYIFAGGSQAWDTSIITLVGTDFAIDGVPVDFGRYFFSDYDEGILTGTLINGDTLNNRFEISDGASIVLIPEPTTILLLGLGGLWLRKRRRRF